MPWFKVDDSFYDHPKFLGLSNAAVGLWVKAGAWCGKHLTDGVIPAEKVKTLRGTPAQIRDLIAAGLWVECESEVGAKAYRFHDWIEYQPTRKQTLKERADSAERQRKSRERKQQEQAQRENVTLDSRGHVTRDSHESHNTLSQRPDPTRPDPTNRGGEVVSKGKVVGGQDSPPSLDDLVVQHAASGAAAEAPGGVHGTPDDPRCAKHAHLDRADVPKCRDCAAAREHYEAQAAEDHRQRRTLIDACEMCDDRGLVDTTDTDGRPVAVKCDHTTPPARPTATQTAWQPTSGPKARRALFNALNERTAQNKEPA